MCGRYATVLLALLCAGCAEHTVIRSEPPGADLYVNERFVGVTPVEYSVSRAEFSTPLMVCLEREGYRLFRDELPKTVGAGRIVGGGFSLGISLIFKRPTTLRGHYDFLLVPASEARGDAPRCTVGRP
jgi:hypothetical protein